MIPQIDAHVPHYVHLALQTLKSHGKQGYLVGGSLRDILRGATPHDFDLTANATPQEMLEIFKDFRVIPTGLAHGTVTVLLEGHPTEITTHRTDGTYTDSRHPDSVTFTTDLTEDLARRDFTVNAMAWSEETGLVDPFGGIKDLAAGILRAVGDPETRFSEDALRILRCFRFTAQLDLCIDDATLLGAKKRAAGLADISVERIFSELTRTVTSPAAKKGFLAMQEAGCIPYVFFDTIPDLTVLDALEKLPPEAPLRLAALLHSHPERALAALAARWHAPNAFTKALIAYIAAFFAPVPHDPFAARAFVCRHYPHFEGGLLLRCALRGEAIDEAIDLSRKVLSDGTAVELRRLAVSGKELQEKLGVRPAKTGQLLLRLQELVWQEPSRNRRGILLALAKTITEQEAYYCE